MLGIGLVFRNKSRTECSKGAKNDVSLGIALFGVLKESFELFYIKIGIPKSLALRR
jgi:hypothetical protein